MSSLKDGRSHVSIAEEPIPLRGLEDTIGGRSGRNDREMFTQKIPRSARGSEQDIRLMSAVTEEREVRHCADWFGLQIGLCCLWILWVSVAQVIIVTVIG